MSEHVFETAPSSVEPRRQVDWHYPLFLDGKPSQTGALNSWLRQLTLRPLAECSNAPDKVLSSRLDRQVVQMLESNSGIASCGIIRSILSPREAFGQYVSFELQVAWTGDARSFHRAETFTFDMKRAKPIGIDAFFKPEALDQLNEALAEEIQRTRPDCRGRAFDWSQATLRPPDQVFTVYPFDAAEWSGCGDGIELIEGRTVSDLLLNPKALRPLRRLVEVK